MKSYQDMIGKGFSMTGVLDVDREILLRVDDKELFELCIPPKNKYMKKVCNEDFFSKRILKIYPSIYKPNDMSWRKLYIYTLVNFFNKDEKLINYFLENKNKLNFFNKELSDFLKSLDTEYGSIGKEIFRIIYHLFFDYDLLSMEAVFQIITIIKTLKLGNSPDNFIQLFKLRENLDPIEKAYLTNNALNDLLKEIEGKIMKIYEREIKNKKN